MSGPMYFNRVAAIFLVQIWGSSGASVREIVALSRPGAQTWPPTWPVIVATFVVSASTKAVAVNVALLSAGIVTPLAMLPRMSSSKLTFSATPGLGLVTT